MTSFADLSIIIPYYKGNSYINQLLYSLQRNQERAKAQWREVIIVNDSPEEKVQIAARNQQQLNVKLITNSTNYGIHRSRVIGVMHAKGKYILMIDQDDMLTDNALVEIIKAISSQKNLDMYIFNAYNRKCINGRIMDNLHCPHRYTTWLITSVYINLVIGNQIISPGHVVIKRKFIPFDWRENIIKKNGSDDWFLWLIMYKKQCKAMFFDSAIYYHIDHGENFSNNERKMLQSECEILDILNKQKLLTKCQRWLFERRIRYSYLRTEKKVKNNIKILLFYPDFVLQKSIFKLIKNILFLIN